ncbi:Hypothetical predicted protein [Prunus dulcis]|uniref:Uncharacterized protein n=1 Tax=Prunus dulcis TaxID=3755 RepID=A0A5E4FII6_PRUDU|nr:Hypothetical predicted protein [Prunus dulcis]
MMIFNNMSVYRSRSGSQSWLVSGSESGSGYGSKFNSRSFSVTRSFLTSILLRSGSGLRPGSVSSKIGSSGSSILQGSWSGPDFGSSKIGSFEYSILLVSRSGW